MLCSNDKNFLPRGLFRRAPEVIHRLSTRPVAADVRRRTSRNCGVPLLTSGATLDNLEKSSYALKLMTNSLLSEKVQWRIIACLGVLIPAFIFYVRFRLRIAEPFAFVPLSGVENGRDPQLFARIIHDLTHPVFLLCYAVVLTLVAVRQVRRPMSARSNEFLLAGLSLIHLALLVSYAIALFLPIGDMVSVITK